jgi:two-component system response regulator GlrR
MPSLDGVLIGTSRSFLQVTGMIQLLSKSKSTVLISGETGTGKELFARAIHYSGERRGKPFVPVNCAALPDHLIENELFGHSKGAFTGALTEKPGLFHEADGGTLFLDEINSLSMTVQSKLLRVLQDQEFRPLGSTKSQKVDVKILAASNTDLRHMVETRQFREDLFHRLNVLSVVLPPLRDRKEDVLLLANHFLNVYAKEFSRGAMMLGHSAKAKLTGYSWPGNVRELEGVVHRAVAMASGEQLESQDLDLPETASPAPTGPTMMLLSRGVMPSECGFQEMKEKVIEEFEMAFLSELLSAYHGNISRAARAAKKERRAFQRLLQKHHLDRRIYTAA